MGTSLLLETTTTMMMMLHVACHFAGDALCSRSIINQHKSGRESKSECFVVLLLHFQGSVFTFPTVEWRGKIIWREANDRICALRPAIGLM